MIIIADDLTREVQAMVDDGVVDRGVRRGNRSPRGCEGSLGVVACDGVAQRSLWLHAVEGLAHHGSRSQAEGRSGGSPMVSSDSVDVARFMPSLLDTSPRKSPRSAGRPNEACFKSATLMSKQPSPSCVQSA